MSKKVLVTLYAPENFEAVKKDLTSLFGCKASNSYVVGYLVRYYLLSERKNIRG